MDVRNRQQMAQLLNERMNRTYLSLRQRQELEKDTSLLKTYLVEADVPDGSSAASLAEQAFSPDLLGKKTSQLRSIETEDPNLAVISGMLFGQQLDLFIDVANPRFWLLHTMAGSGAADWLIDRAVVEHSHLDRAWLPADLLQDVSRLGSFRGLGLDYDQRVLLDEDSESDDEPVEFLKMQLWGNRASAVLEILRAEDAFPRQTTLAKVRVKYWDESDRESFTVDDVKWDGKITARGTSFQSHLALVMHVYDRYSNQITGLEERNRSSAVERPGDGQGVYGDPVSFLLDPPIRDLAVFCRNFLSCAEPFRLWGVPVPVAEDFFRVEALDLHVSKTITLEIAPELIRVFLPKDGCGNSLLRIYTNLQHHYSAQVTAVGAQGVHVLDF